MKTLYHNAKIYTMKSDDPTSPDDSMVVSRGKVVETGNLSDLGPKFKKIRKVDLGGKTVLPGFMDAHGHFIIASIAESLFVPIFSDPLGKIDSIGSAVDALVSFNNEKNPSVIIGYGFDDTKVEDVRMPDRHDLDKISSTKPVMVLHQSLHMASVNTHVLELSGYVDEKNVPDGGVVYKDDDGFPTGLIEETPAIMPVYEKIIFPVIKQKNIFSIINEGSRKYLSRGFTTVHEGAASQNQLKVFKLANLLRKMPAKLIFTAVPDKNGKLPKYRKKQGTPLDTHGKITPGPVKLFTDGSIQAYTAYLSKPYHKPHPTRMKDKNYRGYLTVKEDAYRNTVKHIHESGMQYAVHANGDEAIKFIIDAEKQFKKPGDPGNIIIHCQLVTKQSLKDMKELGMSASFFPSHVFIWGKEHCETYLGEERASSIDPLKTAQEEGVLFSIHHDAPVSEPDPWIPIWSSVMRLDREGNVLGPQERVTPYEAVKAVTKNAYLQYGIKDRGVLNKGMRADFIVLDQDPFNIPPKDILKTKVLKTFVNGKLVYLKK